MLETFLCRSSTVLSQFLFKKIFQNMKMNYFIWCEICIGVAAIGYVFSGSLDCSSSHSRILLTMVCMLYYPKILSEDGRKVGKSCMWFDCWTGIEIAVPWQQGWDCITSWYFWLRLVLRDYPRKPIFLCSCSVSISPAVLFCRGNKHGKLPPSQSSHRFIKQYEPLKHL